MTKLCIINGPMEGHHSLALKNDTIIIGMTPDSDIQIKDHFLQFKSPKTYYQINSLIKLN